MTKLWRLIAAFGLVAGAVTAASPAGTAAASPVGERGVTAAPAEDDIKVKLAAIPGITIVEEKPAEAGFRYFVLRYTQPVDHHHPEGDTFQQRLTLLHKATDRPVVLHTSGYNVRTTPSRSEPTQLIDGNQISTEQRFFNPSRPSPTDWTKLDIWQAANDHHRIVVALKAIYAGRWISTGASKGGMTSIYHRRFFPKDVDGTIAYVAPNDVDNAEDAAYTKFFTRVGTQPCRKALKTIQIEALKRRPEMVAKYTAWAAAEKRTFETLVGDVDHAFEFMVTDAVWAFWQYAPATECAKVPAATATSDVIFKWFDDVSGLDGYTDEGLEGFLPYYYQAGTQLGSPDITTAHLTPYLKYPGQNTIRVVVPRDIPMTFDPTAMKDIDTWVQAEGRKLLFVYGADDPWGAEPFTITTGHDAYSFTAIGANHGAKIASLTAAQQTLSKKALNRWAGITAPAGLAAKRIPSLDDVDPDLERRPVLAP